MMHLTFLLLLSCSKEKDNGDIDTATESTTEDSIPICGDGIINQSQEECDDGTQNSNTESNACREDCLLPSCGDLVVDTRTEECDDGNFWNQDGCSDVCIIENGVFETEPNSTPEQAQETTDNGYFEGALWEGDSDCIQLNIQENDYARVWVSGDIIVEEVNEETEEVTQVEYCSEQTQLSIYKNGTLVHNEYPQTEQDCISIDFSDNEYMRFLSTENQYVVCIEGFLGSTVSSYTLNWEIEQNSCSLQDLTLTTDEDPDFDLLANPCDEDDDNDGRADEEDNCPIDPNNGPLYYYTDADGFIMDWLVLGPIPGQSTTSCSPVEGLTQTSENSLYPNLGDLEIFSDESSLLWQLFKSNSSRVNFLEHSDLGAMPAPREVFAAVWIYSPQARSSQLKIGPDDGARAWLNGSFVGETAACQGTVVDNYIYDAPLLEGWNHLVIQIRDNGGGWGLYTRFTENDTPITNIDISPAAASYFEDSQLDSDGDGIGDQCDD